MNGYNLGIHRYKEDSQCEEKRQNCENYHHDNELCMEEQLGENANMHFKIKALNGI